MSNREYPPLGDDPRKRQEDWLDEYFFLVEDEDKDENPRLIKQAQIDAFQAMGLKGEL